LKVNVSGPLNLLRLAENALNFECYCHISSCYTLVDKEGLLEEKMFDSPVNWSAIY